MDEHKKIEIPLERIFPEQHKLSKFSDDFVVQHQLDRFTLSFFEIVSPLIAEESEEERHKQLENLNSIESICVARLIMTPREFKKVLQAMTTNLEKYEAKFGSID